MMKNKQFSGSWWASLTSAMLRGKYYLTLLYFSIAQKRQQISSQNFKNRIRHQSEVSPSKFQKKTWRFFVIKLCFSDVCSAIFGKKNDRCFKASTMYQFSSKTRSQNIKRCKIVCSTKWILQIFDVFRFWLQKAKILIFQKINAYKIQNFGFIQKSGIPTCCNAAYKHICKL